MEDRLQAARSTSFMPGDPAWPEFELGRRVLECGENLHEFPDRTEGALLLLREAALLGVRARLLRSCPDAAGSIAAADEVALWDRFLETPAGAKLLERWSDTERARIRQALFEARADQLSRLDRQVRRSHARTLARFAPAVIEDLEREGSAVAWVHTVRRLRITGAVVLVVVLILLGWWLAARALKPSVNLALGKPVTCSSYYQRHRFPPERLVDGDRSAIGFHTRLEDNPYVIIDLLRSETVQRVVVTNRTDRFRERAVPLVIETSEDGQRYLPFARRDDVFTVWEAKAGPTRARYVKLSVPRRVELHLNEVEVY